MGPDEPQDPFELEPDFNARTDSFFGGPPPMPGLGQSIPAPVAAAPSVPPPLPGVATAAGTPVAQVAASPQPVVRDRILVLGRRKAGKSVFLARLYERLWNSKGEIHMAATDGQTHVALLTQIDEMSKRRWPAATEQLTHFTIDVTYRDERFSMVAPDYPGEIFKRAFMSGSDEPLVRELLANIDRAAAVIVLVDPQVAGSGSLLEHSEQDFGLVAAIKRIRDSAGAEFVPVAIALTKCDICREDIEAAGGPGKYIRETYMNLCRVTFRKGHKGTVFACSAVSVKRDGLGKEVPDLSKPPRGLIEPLEYCLQALSYSRTAIAERNRREELAAAAAANAERERQEERKSAQISSVVLIGCVLFAAIIVVVLVVALTSSSSHR